MDTTRQARGAAPESGADIRVQSDVFASGDEKILFERLYEQSPDLGYMFYSALFVLRRNAPGQSSNPRDPPGGVNPNRMAHSAHSVRETLVHAEKKLKLDLFAYSTYGKTTPTSADKTEKNLNNPTHVEKIQSISDPGRYLPKHLSRLYKDINKRHMWFVGVAHHGPPPPEQEYCKKLGAFTRDMNRLLEPYFQVTRQIDAALKDQGADLEKMEALLCKSWQAYNYFFKNAPARWLDALIRRGTYFVHVPGSVSDTGEYMPIVWPESRYLARIAGERPEQVTYAILKVRVTERKNPTVLADFAQAASKMSAKFGKKIADKALEEQWHRNAGQRLPWIVAEQIGALAAKLAFKEFGTALKLCENLLHLNDGDGYARGYLSDYDYRCVLETTVTVLAERDANKTLDMLCDRLSRAVRTVNAGLGGGYMPSSSWHWDVGCDERNMHMGAISLLIVAIRKVLEMSERRIDDLAGSLEVLDSYEDPVFLRIKMHFYAKHPARFAQKMTPLASSQFDVKECESEYRRMLQFGYPHFDDDTRKDLRAKILAGPSPDTGDPAGHERRKDSWTLEKLHPLRNVEEFNPEYTSLKIKLGGPMDFGEHTPAYATPKPTLDPCMSPEEVIQYLESHKDEFDDNYHEFRRSVSRNPSEYCRLASRMLDMPALFLRAFFDELSDADAALDWEPVLELCGLLMDDDASLVFDSLLDDCGNMLKKNLASDKIPFRLRGKVWNVLDRATQIVLSRYGQHREYSKPGDAFNSCINSGTGQTTLAIVQYAAWCHRGLARGSEPGRLVDEARSALESLLDRHKSNSVHAAMGINFAVLVSLDEAWASKRTNGIFEHGHSSGAAAWEAYVRGDVHQTSFELLYEEYLYRFDIVSDPVTLRMMSDHVAVAHLNGLEKTDALIDSIIEKDSPGLLSHLVEFIGQYARKLSSEDLKADMDAFASREEVSKTPSAGWLFLNRHADNGARLALLDRVLVATGGKIEPAHLVIEDLQSTSRSHPVETARCVRKIVSVLKTGDGVHVVPGIIDETLQAILEAKDADAKLIVKQVANELGAYGFEQFRKFS